MKLSYLTLNVLLKYLVCVLKVDNFRFVRKEDRRVLQKGIQMSKFYKLIRHTFFFQNHYLRS